MSQAAGSTPSTTRPDAHVAQALAAIVFASLAFAASMAALGTASRMDEMIVAAFGSIRPEGGFLEPSMPWVWVSSGLGSVLSASVLLHTPGWWRRVVFLSALMAVTAAWAPVLALASLRPAIAIPALAVMAAGAGSLFYAARHPLPTNASHEAR